MAMKQDKGEAVRTFVTKLKGQATNCRFVTTTECPHCEASIEANYSNAMIRDILIWGLEDTDIQVDILSIITKEMTLEESVTFVEAKEMGKQSATHISQVDGAHHS